MKLKQAEEIHGGPLGKNSKMPGRTTGHSARNCNIGSRLQSVPGSTCFGCYGLASNYFYPNVQLAHDRRYANLEHEHWIEAMSTLIAHYSASHFRWHDVGDIKDIRHLDRIVQIAKNLPSTAFWLPTREIHTVRQYGQESLPSNLVVRLSALMVDTHPPVYSELEALTTSTVHTVKHVASKANTECKAYLRDGSCGSCRACWSPDVPNVSYHAHAGLKNPLIQLTKGQENNARN